MANLADGADRAPPNTLPRAYCTGAVPIAMLLASPRIALAAAGLDAYETLTQAPSAVTVDIAFGLKSGITGMGHVKIVMRAGDMNKRRELNNGATFRRFSGFCSK
jgi:hypothetical protein